MTGRFYIIEMHPQSRHAMYYMGDRQWTFDEKGGVPARARIFSRETAEAIIPALPESMKPHVAIVSVAHALGLD